jgi:hypothetical protein
MLKLIRKIFKIDTKVWHHMRGLVKKDRSGRYRYFIYVDGKLVKENRNFSFWYQESEE